MRLEEYHRLAKVEDQLWYFETLHQRMWQPLISRVPYRDRILDAGCGTGGLLRFLRRKSSDWQLDGVDNSREACTYARQKTKASIHHASITDLPFDGCTFDAVLAADVLCQIKNDKAAVLELARVLKPNGLLVVHVPAYPWLWSYHDIVCETERRYLPSDLLGLMQGSGLRTVYLSHANMWPLPLIVLKRKFFPNSDGGSDVRFFSNRVDRMFRKLDQLDRATLRGLGRLPIGSSLFLMAEKK